MYQPKLCVIGAGRHAKNNIYPAMQAAGACIEAISTRHLDSALAAAERFAPSANAYEDYHEMLEKEDCDGVIIVAQAEDQYAIALDCLRQKKPIFVEKPLGWTVKQAEDIAACARQNGVFATVAFMKRFAPAYQTLMKYISEERLGKVLSFNVFFATDTSVFCETPEDYIKSAGIHMLDLCLALFGEVSTIKSMQKTQGRELAMSACLQTKQGALGSIYFYGGKAWSREKETITVTMENGFVHIEDLSKIVVHKNKKPSDALDKFDFLDEEDSVCTPGNSPATGALCDIVLRGFVGEIQHFVSCLQDGKAPLFDEQSNVETMQFLEDFIAGF